MSRGHGLRSTSFSRGNGIKAIVPPGKLALL